MNEENVNPPAPATSPEATGSAQCKMCGASFSPIWLKELQKMSTVCPACVIEALEKMVNLNIWPNDLLKHMLPNAPAHRPALEGDNQNEK